MENGHHLPSPHRSRAFSSPELVQSPTRSSGQPEEDHSLEGISTNVKLLLKLLHDHCEGTMKNNDDDRKSLRVAGMMTIIEDVKSRIEKSHNSAGKKRMAELRRCDTITPSRSLSRCNTDLRPNRVPKEKKPHEPVMDEKEKLRKQLNASLAARKSLEIMCSSLGKEKEIIAKELARKVHEMNEMEELVNAVKEQNQTLMTKIKACAAEEQEKQGNAGESVGYMVLQERNRLLSDQLLRSLDSYRSLKRKYKVSLEENMGNSAIMGEIRQEVAVGLQLIRSFKNRMAKGEVQPGNIEEDISALEHMFERFHLKLSKKEDNDIVHANRQAEINANEPPVFA